MRRVLALESIGDSAATQFDDMLNGRRSWRRMPVSIPRKPVVCRLIGDRAVPESYLRDYSMANRSGNRGIWYIYVLQEGCAYRIIQPMTWSRCETWHAIVDEQGIHRVLEGAALEWARQV